MKTFLGGHKKWEMKARMAMDTVERWMSSVIYRSI